MRLRLIGIMFKLIWMRLVIVYFRFMIMFIVLRIVICWYFPMTDLRLKYW
jgi:hypothetical protein